MELKTQLTLLNEWWQTGKVSPSRLKSYRRTNYESLLWLTRYRQIVLLTGLRRVGKSTLLFQLIEHLLQQTAPRNILYFSLDEQAEDVLKILESYQELTQVDWKNEKVYVLLDEIQKLKDWSSKIKIIYDNFPGVKFFVSGSASLQLQQEAIRNLAGRYFLEEVPPLPLKEFFELKHHQVMDNFALYRQDLKKEIGCFLKRPFPEIVSWDDENRVFEYIREGVISKVVKVDLPETFDNVNTQLLMTLLEIIYREPGMILNGESLSKDLKIHKRTLEKHLYILEFSKLVRKVRNYRVSASAETRKLPKVYPFHIALALAFYPDVEKGRIWETAVATRLNAGNYWREAQKEIDFIIKGKKIIPLEVKSKEVLRDADTKTLRDFMRKFAIPEGIVIYDGENRQNDSLSFRSFVDLLHLGIEEVPGP